MEILDRSVPALFGARVPFCPLAWEPGAVLSVRRGLVGSSSKQTFDSFFRGYYIDFHLIFIISSSKRIILNVWWYCKCWIQFCLFICVFRDADIGTVNSLNWEAKLIDSLLYWLDFLALIVSIRNQWCVSTILIQFQNCLEVSCWWSLDVIWRE